MSSTPQPIQLLNMSRSISFQIRSTRSADIVQTRNCHTDAATNAKGIRIKTMVPPLILVGRGRRTNTISHYCPFWHSVFEDKLALPHLCCIPRLYIAPYQRVCSRIYQLLYQLFVNRFNKLLTSVKEGHQMHFPHPTWGLVIIDCKSHFCTFIKTIEPVFLSNTFESFLLHFLDSA